MLSDLRQKQTYTSIQHTEHHKYHKREQLELLIYQLQRVGLKQIMLV